MGKEISQDIDEAFEKPWQSMLCQENKDKMRSFCKKLLTRSFCERTKSILYAGKPGKSNSSSAICFPPCCPFNFLKALWYTLKFVYLKKINKSSTLNIHWDCSGESLAQSLYSSVQTIAVIHDQITCQQDVTNYQLTIPP